MLQIVRASVVFGHSQILRVLSKQTNGRQPLRRPSFETSIQRLGHTMQKHPRSLGIAALLLATSAWGGMFLISKGVLQHVDPFWLTLIRYSLSAILFMALLVPRGAAPWLKLRAHAMPLAIRGLAGFG